MPSTLLRAAVGTPALPDGSSFSPPWRPREDMYLGEGMLLQGLTSFDCPGLGQSMASSSEEARDAIEEVALYLEKARESRRSADELIMRFLALRDVYGPATKDFHHFQRHAKAATLANAESPGPDSARASKRPRTTPLSASPAPPASSAPPPSSAASVRQTPRLAAAGTGAGPSRASAYASSSASSARAGSSSRSSAASGATASVRADRKGAARRESAGTPHADLSSLESSSTPAARTHAAEEEDESEEECPTGGRPAAPKRIRTVGSTSSRPSTAAAERTPMPVAPGGGGALAAGGAAAAAAIRGAASASRSGSSAATGSTAGLTASGSGQSVSGRRSSCMTDPIPSCPSFNSSASSASVPHTKTIALVPPTPSSGGSGSRTGSSAASAPTPGSTASAASAGVQPAVHSAAASDSKLRQATERASKARANANAMTPSAISPSLLAWARRSVLGTLNAPPALSALHDGLNTDGPRAAVRSELVDLLGRTMERIENVSTLLVGPRGAGKHRLLSSVLRQLARRDLEGDVGDGGATGGSSPLVGSPPILGSPNGGSELDGAGFLRVDLHPMLVQDEPTALMAIASQLRVNYSSATLRGSFCDGLRNLMHLLTRTCPAGAGEEVTKGEQRQPVIFVLHAFEQFCARPKQTLLYSIFDLMQTDNASMAVIGLTTRIDVADLLEKRVRSRCGHRQMWLPALDKAADCVALLESALKLPDVPADSSPTATDSPERAARFCEAWAAQSAHLCAQLPYSTLLRRRLSVGVTPNQLQMALRLALSELSSARPERNLVYLEQLDTAMKLMLVPRDELVLCECTAVELLLLLCIKKLGDKELPPPHSLRMALREYKVFVASSGGPQYDYPNPLLVASFEHLCALGLVIATRESRQRALPTEQLPLRLGTDAQTLHDFVKSHTELPTEVHRFGTTMTI